MGNKTKTCSDAHARRSGLAQPKCFPAAAVFVLLPALILLIVKTALGFISVFELLDFFASLPLAVGSEDLSEVRRHVAEPCGRCGSGGLVS